MRATTVEFDPKQYELDKESVKHQIAALLLKYGDAYNESAKEEMTLKMRMELVGFVNSPLKRLPPPPPTPTTPRKGKVVLKDLARVQDAEEKLQPPLYPSLGRIYHVAACCPNTIFDPAASISSVRRAWNGRIFVDVFHPSVSPMKWAGKTPGISFSIVRRPVAAKELLKTPSRQLERKQAVVAEVVMSRGVSTMRSMGYSEAAVEGMRRKYLGNSPLKEKVVADEAAGGVTNSRSLKNVFDQDDPWTSGSTTTRAKKSTGPAKILNKAWSEFIKKSGDGGSGSTNGQAGSAPSTPTEVVIALEDSDADTMDCMAAILEGTPEATTSDAKEIGVEHGKIPPQKFDLVI